MKKRDIKKLEKVAELYGKIAELLDDVYDDALDESIEMSDRGHTKVCIRHLVRDSLEEAQNSKMFFNARIKQIKEQLT